MNYTRPGVYTENNTTSVEQPVVSSTNIIASFIGATRKGDCNVPILITSWQDYLNKFCEDKYSPFITGTYFAQAVYGYFLNGGKYAYIVRVRGTKGKIATKKSATSDLTFSAVNEGLWGNQFSVKIEANGDDKFNIIVLRNDTEQMEKFTVKQSEESNIYYEYVVNTNSKYIRVTATGDLAEETIKLEGGINNPVEYTDSDYINAINALKQVERVDTIAVPGIVTSAVQETIIKVSNEVQARPILDCAKGLDVDSVIKAREALLDNKGALYYPWILLKDQVYGKGTRLCPPSGHISGVYSRICENRGIHKAPAGLEALIKGALGVEVELSEEDQAKLNPKSVNCIVNKHSNGVVVWGARTMSSDDNFKYVSDVALYNYIEKNCYNNLQWAVFEPMDEKLYADIEARLKGVLTSMLPYLKGNTPEEAFYVKCDTDLNTDEVRSRGEVIAEVGYASAKPGEFIVLKIVQKSQA